MSNLKNASFAISSKRHKSVIVFVVMLAAILCTASIIIISKYFEKLKSDAKSNLTLIESKRNAYVEGQLNARRDLLIKLDKNLRVQMRLNLSAVGKNIEGEINKLDKVSSQEELLSKIKEITAKSIGLHRTFNDEGDWFVVVTVGGNLYFLNDDSSDCSSPLVNGTPLLTIPDRYRNMFDEVIWQEETKYILSLYGLINEPSYFKSINKNKVNLNILKKYNIDGHLDNVEVYRTKEIDYIRTRYNDVYTKLKNLKIIMHDSVYEAEVFMNFLSYNRSTVDGDNLFWHFNPPDLNSKMYNTDELNPNREILEVYVIPAGVFGFFNEPRTKGSGVFNDKYIKISLVAGAQILDYYKSYEKELSVFDSNIKNIDEFIKLSELNTTRIIKSIEDMSMICILSICIFISLATLFSLYSYTRVPTEILTKEFKLCSQNCSMRTTNTQ